MASPRFYVEKPLAQGANIILSERAARHARVLRLNKNDEVVLFDGSGVDFAGVITRGRKGQIQVSVGVGHEGLADPVLDWHLAIAVIKREAMNLALQKATEVGVTAITPVFTEYTDAPHGSADRRHNNWLGVLSSAAEQCGRSRLPTLNAACQFTDCLKVCADLRLIPEPAAELTIETVATRPQSLFTLVGPEGGFSPAEVAAAEKTGFVAISLGPRILRADTVPAVLGALVQSRWGDLS
jgi:16S rRNA (uracil1498-N3)-methyltransferase